jgi:hypothetical protein
VEPLGVRAMLEPDNNIIGEPHDDHVTVGMPFPPLPGPEIEDVVQVDICEQG